MGIVEFDKWKRIGGGRIQRRSKNTVLEWKESELKNVDRKSRKTMTMYGALHPRSDVDRLYFKRKEVGRCLMSVEYCVRENNLGFYTDNSKEHLIRGVSAAKTINTEEIVRNLSALIGQ